MNQELVTNYYKYQATPSEKPISLVSHPGISTNFSLSLSRPAFLKKPKSKQKVQKASKKIVKKSASVKKTKKVINRRKKDIFG